MGFNRDIKIQRPTGRKLLLLVPFALCYACFVVLGDWQGSVGYSNAQNLGRLVLWAAGSFAVLFAAGFLLENWAVLIALMPSGARVVYEKMFPPRKARQGQWWIWLAFFMFCLLCYLPYFLIYIIRRGLTTMRCGRWSRRSAWRRNPITTPIFIPLSSKCF